MGTLCTFSSLRSEKLAYQVPCNIEVKIYLRPPFNNIATFFSSRKFISSGVGSYF
jgi:hypothetical protein